MIVAYTEKNVTMEPAAVNLMKLIALTLLLIGCVSTETEVSKESDETIQFDDFLNRDNYVFNTNCKDSEKELNGICVNKNLPPKPSITRGYGKASRKDDSMPATIGGNDWRPVDQFENPEYKILPYFRTSLDGRLILAGGNNWFNKPLFSSIPSMGGFAVSFMVFDPEEIAEDQKIKNTNPMVSGYPLHPFMYMALHPKFTSFDIDQEPFLKNTAPPTYSHNDICHDKSLEVPRKCRAPQFPGSQNFLQGDCYDISVIFFPAMEQLMDDGNGGLIKRNTQEIRSNSYTVFVQNGKSNGQKERVFIYPRINAETLPAITNVQNLHNICIVNTSQGKQIRYGNSCNFQNMNYSNVKELSAYCLESDGSLPSDPNTKPFYCQYIYSQKYLPFFKFHKGGGKSGAPENYFSYTAPSTRLMFEPSLSGDGRLLIINAGLGKGGYYSYNNEADLCDVSGWKTFEPISNLPFDPNIYQNYELGKSQRRRLRSLPFRDSLGRNIPRRENIAASYLWMDRKVKNLFFEILNFNQDQYLDNEGTVMDQASGKYYHALGAWTRGKMVGLDGVLNMYDFGTRPEVEAGKEKIFNVSLYQDEVSQIRPVSSTMLGSFENLFNYYDSLSPTLPFDVVWKFSSNRERNSEVVFDEYLMNNAVVVAHMNPASSSFARGDNHFYYSKNGFVPQDLWQLSGNEGAKPIMTTMEYPTLQNSATQQRTLEGSKIPQKLTLLGGARTESIAQGGVYGKGVFLDGINDHIQLDPIKGLGDKTKDWIVTIWLEPHYFSNPRQFKTLFKFPDNSEIQLSKNKIIAIDSKGTQKNMDLSDLELENKKFIHLGLKITSDSSHRRILKFYINGSPVYNTINYQTSSGIFQPIRIKELYFHGQDAASVPFKITSDDSLIIGRGKAVNSVFKGWMDELRMFDFAATKSISPFYEEFICNQAFGSLMRVDEELAYTDSRIASMQDKARKHQLFKLPINKGISSAGAGQTRLTQVFPIDNKADVCEQMILESYNSPNEFADQGNKTLCGARVHKNREKPEFCVREEYLDIKSKMITATATRPDFSQTDFCLSCHDRSANIKPLQVRALTPGDVPRYLDPRRQPLVRPAFITGCLPENIPGDDECTKTYLDHLFDNKLKL